MPSSVIAGNKIYKCEDPDGFAFSIASSSMFITWQKAIGGRLKSDCNFSNTLVWNTVPLPEITKEQKVQIIAVENEIVEERKKFPGKSLAELYNPLSMNVSLLRLHQELDNLVDSCFGHAPRKDGFGSREETLFEKYSQLTHSLII
jgi:hypothetical protein